MKCLKNWIAVTFGLLHIGLFYLCLGASCGQKIIGIMPGVINDPHNLSLRRAIFDFGIKQMCSDMQSRGVSIRLTDEAPASGRFFPKTCFAETLDNGNLFLQFGGFGYVWTNMTKRLAFDASGAVEYSHDFLMDGSAMYLYFRSKSIHALSFKTRFIENQLAAAMGGMTMGGSQSMSDSVGIDLLKKQMSRGFTVIRQANSSATFGMGVIEKGDTPATPYKVSDSDKIVLANERSEIHQNQRDYVGPIVITEKEKAIRLTVAVEAAPTLDVLIAADSVAQAWLEAYTRQVYVTPPSGQVLLDETLQPAFANLSAPWRKTLSVPPGTYYVVFDQTVVAGHSSPIQYPMDDRAALANYAIEVIDAP